MTTLTQDIFKDVEPQYQWAAMNRDGIVHAYVDMPLLGKGAYGEVWRSRRGSNTVGKRIGMTFDTPVDDWQDMLIQRQQPVPVLPLTSCLRPAPVGYLACTREYGHDGPCAMPERPPVPPAEVTEEVPGWQPKPDMANTAPGVDKNWNKPSKKADAKAYREVRARMEHLIAAKEMTETQGMALFAGLPE